MTDEQMDALLRVLDKIEDTLADIHAELDRHNTMLEELTRSGGEGIRILRVDADV